MSKLMATIGESSLVENIIVVEDYTAETDTLKNIPADKFCNIGFTYDEARDAFIPPQPYPSWVLDEATCQWGAPIPMPDGDYVWDEEAGNWILTPDPS